MPVHFKLTQPDGLTRRLVFSERPNWTELALKLEQLFSIPLRNVAVSYVDSDGDEVTLSTTEELQDFYVSPENSESVIKFTVKNLSATRDSLRTPPTNLSMPEGFSSMGVGEVLEELGINPHIYPDIVEEDWQDVPYIGNPLFSLSQDDQAAAAGVSTPPHIEVVESEVSDDPSPRSKPLSDSSSAAEGPFIDPTTAYNLRSPIPSIVEVKSQNDEFMTEGQSEVRGPTYTSEEKGKGKFRDPRAASVVDADSDSDSESEIEIIPVEEPEMSSAPSDASIVNGERTPKPPMHIQLVDANTAPVDDAPSTFSDPPLMTPSSTSATSPSLMNDLATFLNSLNVAFSSHPELSEGWRNIVRNATNGGYREDVMQSARDAANSINSVVEDRAGRRVAEALSGIFRALGDEAGAVTAAHDGPTNMSQEPAESNTADGNHPSHQRRSPPPFSAPHARHTQDDNRPPPVTRPDEFASLFSGWHPSPHNHFDGRPDIGARLSPRRPRGPEIFLPHRGPRGSMDRGLDHERPPHGPGAHHHSHHHGPGPHHHFQTIHTHVHPPPPPPPFVPPGFPPMGRMPPPPPPPHIHGPGFLPPHAPVARSHGPFERPPLSDLILAHPIDSFKNEPGQSSPFDPVTGAPRPGKNRAAQDGTTSEEDDKYAPLRNLSQPRGVSPRDGLDMDEYEERLISDLENHRRVKERRTKLDMVKSQYKQEKELFKAEKERLRKIKELRERNRERKLAEDAAFRLVGASSSAISPAGVPPPPIVHPLRPIRPSVGGIGLDDNFASPTITANSTDRTAPPHASSWKHLINESSLSRTSSRYVRRADQVQRGPNAGLGEAATNRSILTRLNDMGFSDQTTPRINDLIEKHVKRISPNTNNPALPLSPRLSKEQEDEIVSNLLDEIITSKSPMPRHANAPGPSGSKGADKMPGEW